MKVAFGRGALIRSALIVTGATSVSYITGLAISMLVARGLGPADYGRYSYVVWLSGILVVCCTNGLTTTGIKFIAECLGRDDDEGARRVYGLLRRYFVVSLVAVALGFMLVARFVLPDGWEGGVVLLIVVVLAGSLPKALYLLHSSMAKGYGNFSIEANTTNILGVAGLLATIGLVATRQPLDAYLFLFVLLSMGHAVLTLGFIHRAGIGPSPGAIEPVIAARLHRHLAWTVVLVLLATVSNRSIETFLLNRTAGAEAVGFFIIAATLVRGGADLLANGLSAVLIPAMAHSYGRDGESGIGVILSGAVRYFLFLGLLLAGVGVACADLAIGLMYGPKFQPVIPVFRAMVMVAGLVLMEGAFNALLATTDRQRLRVLLTLVAVAVTAALAFALVPRHGLAGAVATHVIARVVMFVAIMFTATRIVRLNLPWAGFARLLGCAAIAAAAAALAWWAAGAGVARDVAATLVYAVALVACSFLLKAWSAQDLEMLSRLATRYPAIGRIASMLSGIGAR